MAYHLIAADEGGPFIAKSFPDFKSLLAEVEDVATTYHPISITMGNDDRCTDFTDGLTEDEFWEAHSRLETIGLVVNVVRTPELTWLEVP